MNNYETKLNGKIHGLDYNILLLYLKDLQELQKINFKNSSNELFEIIYEDKLYKENLRKISKYQNSIYEKYINGQKRTNNFEGDKPEHINSSEFIETIKPKERITLRNIDLIQDEDDKNDSNKTEEEENNVINEIVIENDIIIKLKKKIKKKKIINLRKII